MIAAHRPSTIVHLAARVGGIGYNQAEPAPLYLDNLLMGTHVIEAARHDPGVDKTVLARHGVLVPEVHAGAVPRGRACGTATRRRPTPPTGWPRRPTSSTPRSTHAQYGQRFAYLIPTNLYGPGDKFHPTVSHVIPALIKKCVEAVESGRRQGRGLGHRPGVSREYLYVDDAAEAIVAGRRDPRRSASPINLGTDHEVTIRETVETIARIVGFDGELRWDPTKPDGQPRRRVDATRAEQLLGWRAHQPFEEGLRATIDWYRANRADAERDPN